MFDYLDHKNEAIDWGRRRPETLPQRHETTARPSELDDSDQLPADRWWRSPVMNGSVSLVEAQSPVHSGSLNYFGCIVKSH